MEGTEGSVVGGRVQSLWTQLSLPQSSPAAGANCTRGELPFSPELDVNIKHCWGYLSVFSLK